MTTVHVVVPEGIDDPARPSGGNAYDRRVCRGLAATGWSVRRARRSRLLAATGRGVVRRPRRRRPGGSPTAPSCCSTGWSPRPPRRCWCRRRAGCGWSRSCTCRWATTRRMDDTRAREGAVLSAAASVVTTSGWARRTLLELYALPGDRVHVAEPGVDAADLAPGNAGAGALLCVAAVIPGKGHDVLLDALATMTDLSWQCLCVGSLDRDPAFAEALRRRVLDGELGDRVCFPGPLTGADLDRQLRRRRPAGAGVARRDVRHGRHRGARPRPAGGRDRGRRGAGGPRSRRRRGRGRGCSCRPATRLRSAPRCGPGWATPSCDGGLRRAARERRASLSGWSTTASVLAGVLAEAARMTVEQIRVSSEWLDLREPADAAARSRDLVEQLRPAAPGNRRPW